MIKIFSENLPNAVQVTNLTRQTNIALKAQWADTVVSRLVGLLGRDSIAPDEALVITDCRSIHMLFMKFPIDVIFVSRKRKVVGLAKNIRPFRLSAYYFKSYYAIELAVGAIEKSATQVGDDVSLGN